MWLYVHYDVLCVSDVAIRTLRRAVCGGSVPSGGQRPGHARADSLTLRHCRHQRPAEPQPAHLRQRALLRQRQLQRWARHLHLPRSGQ